MRTSTILNARSARAGPSRASPPAPRRRFTVRSPTAITCSAFAPSTRLPTRTPSSRCGSSRSTPTHPRRRSTPGRPTAQRSTQTIRRSPTSSSPDSDVDHFECHIDGGSASTCPSSGKSFTDLADGTHTFQVGAVDTAGNGDLSAARSTFTIATCQGLTPTIKASRRDQGHEGCRRHPRLGRERHDRRPRRQRHDLRRGGNDGSAEAATATTWSRAGPATTEGTPGAATTGWRRPR